VNAVLPNPTLLIYPLLPKLSVKSSPAGEHPDPAAAAETAAAEKAWAKVTAGGVDRLMALKIAIPGARGSAAGDVEYFLNGPAIQEYRQDFLISDEDLEDTDD
jgi:hypothetical protein